MKAALGWIAGGSVPMKFVKSVMDILHGDLVTGGRVFNFRVIPMESSMYVNLGRNRLIGEFLKYPADVDRILMLDSDVLMSLEQARVLLGSLSAERPVVSGIYRAANGEGEPWDLTMRKDGDGKLQKCVVGDGIEEIDGVGGGCLAISREVLIEMAVKVCGSRPSWFAYESDVTQFLGEDYSFCERVQALGRKVWVHGGVRVKHWKMRAV